MVCVNVLSPPKANVRIDGKILDVDSFDATASASDIKLGETAYARGQKITGTAQMIYYPETEELVVPDWMVTING